MKRKTTFKMISRIALLLHSESLVVLPRIIGKGAAASRLFLRHPQDGIVGRHIVGSIGGGREGRVNGHGGGT